MLLLYLVTTSINYIIATTIKTK